MGSASSLTRSPYTQSTSAAYGLRFNLARRRNRTGLVNNNARVISPVRPQRITQVKAPIITLASRRCTRPIILISAVAARRPRNAGRSGQPALPAHRAVFGQFHRAATASAGYRPHKAVGSVTHRRSAGGLPPGCQRALPFLAPLPSLKAGGAVMLFPAPEQQIAAAADPTKPVQGLHFLRFVARPQKSRLYSPRKPCTTGPISTAGHNTAILHRLSKASGPPRKYLIPQAFVSTQG